MVQDVGTKGSIVFKPSPPQIIIAVVAASLAIAGIQVNQFLQIKSQSNMAAQTPALRLNPIKTVIALGKLEPKSKVK